MQSPVLQKKRYIFLDIARGIAIVEMIHGHTLHALLATPLRDSGFFTAWTSVRAFTSPFFLFIAGFSFAIATIPRLEKYQQWSPVLSRRISRILFLIIVGYVLHLPFFSLQKTLAAAGTPAWDAFLQIDILQCIGVSLLIVQLMFSLRLKKVVRTLALIVSLALVLILSLNTSHMQWLHVVPRVIRYYFVQSHFPLLPFFAYLLFGVLSGQIFLEKRGRWIVTALVIGISLIGIYYMGHVTRIDLHGIFDWALKSGAVLLLMVVLSIGEKVWSRAPSMIKTFGKEALVLYVVHLFIIYGSVFNKGLRSLWGLMLSYGEVYILFALLVMLLACMVYVWHAAKRSYPAQVWIFRYTLYITFLVRFVTRSY